MPDHSAAAPAGQPELSADGAAFFARRGIATALYDLLFAGTPSTAGDLTWYDALCDGLGPRILDAGCGTGRIARTLARPDRRISGFDASPVLLAEARRALLRSPPPGPVRLTAGRLQDPSLGGPLDVAIVGYYGLAYLLDPGERAAGFAALIDRLRPGGRLVLHLPRADLLRRAVPPDELAAMAFEQPVPGAPGLGLRQSVEAMPFEAGIRSIAFRHQLLREGSVVRDERSVMRLAAVTDAEVLTLADRHGAWSAGHLAGFIPGVASESIHVIERR